MNEPKVKFINPDLVFVLKGILISSVKMIAHRFSAAFSTMSKITLDLTLTY